MYISGLLFEKFTVNCFNLMKQILLSDVYKPRKNKDGRFFLHIPCFISLLEVDCQIQVEKKNFIVSLTFIRLS